MLARAHAVLSNNYFLSVWTFTCLVLSLTLTAHLPLPAVLALALILVLLLDQGHGVSSLKEALRPFSVLVFTLYFLVLTYILFITELKND